MTCRKLKCALRRNDFCNTAIIDIILFSVSFSRRSFLYYSRRHFTELSLTLSANLHGSWSVKLWKSCKLTTFETAEKFCLSSRIRLKMKSWNSYWETERVTLYLNFESITIFSFNQNFIWNWNHNCGFLSTFNHFQLFVFFNSSSNHMH